MCKAGKFFTWDFMPLLNVLSVYITIALRAELCDMHTVKVKSTQNCFGVYCNRNAQTKYITTFVKGLKLYNEPGMVVKPTCMGFIDWQGFSVKPGETCWLQQSFILAFSVHSHLEFKAKLAQAKPPLVRTKEKIL